MPVTRSSVCSSAKVTLAGEYSSHFGVAVLAAWRDVATRTIPDTIRLADRWRRAHPEFSGAASALALSAGTAMALFVLLL